jgi:Holliday junction resolvase
MPPKVQTKTQNKITAPIGYNSNYATGIRAEKKVANEYKKEGWDVVQSAGSRGAADLKCTKGTVKHHVQVKSSTVNNTPYISNHEVGRLKSSATRNDAISVIAKVGKSGDVDIKYAKSKRDVKM